MSPPAALGLSIRKEARALLPMWAGCAAALILVGLAGERRVAEGGRLVYLLGSMALASWSIGVRAQEAPAAERAIVVQNLAPFARDEGVAAVVPFARGAVAKLPDLHVEGRATTWQPIGARWPDGSLRPWDEIRFPFDPSLRQSNDLSRVDVRRLPGPGPEVEERYSCTASGTFEVTLSVVEDGWSQTYRIASHAR